jgi:hypothetical protein
MVAEPLPKLAKGQYALFHCEVKTGIITLPDGRRWIRDDAIFEPFPDMERWASKGKMWLVFDSLVQAQEYAKTKIVVAPEIECHIVDHQNQFVERLWNQEYVDTI